jgi:hypothetical protein
MMARSSLLGTGWLVGLALLVILPYLDGADTSSPAPTLPVKHVTLAATQQSLDAILADFARQTGISVTDRIGAPEAKIDVNLKNATFWEALDAIASAASARVDLSGRDGRLALVKQGSSSRWVSYDGSFRTSVKRLTTSYDFDLDQGTTTLTLEVAWVPDLLPLYLESQPQRLRVLDDNGKTVPLTEEGSALAAVDGRLAFWLDVSLPVLPRKVSKLSLVEGKLSAVAPSKMLTFTFEPLDQLEKAAPEGGRQLTQEGVICKIGKMVLARERWTVRVELRYPEGNKKLDSFQSWVVNNEMVLVSTDGKRRLPSSSHVLEGSSSKQATLSYNFKDLPGNARGKPSDWKLVYRTPARIIEVPIAFSFKDIPLH